MIFNRAVRLRGTGHGRRTYMANTLGKRYMCEKCGTEVLCNKAARAGSNAANSK